MTAQSASDTKQSNNHLHGEKSPYLRQHASNPVDWYPWGEEAFARAYAEDKPIFLSSGYSTCHWCHVMAHDSFVHPQVAAYLNQHFIAIKVDREERPDIDQVYMEVCQQMTGSGGWPLSIVMTPDKLPFFAATFIPSTERYGRIGLLELLPKIIMLWRDARQRLLSHGQEIIHQLSKTPVATADAEPLLSPRLGLAQVEQAVEQLYQRFDRQHGGFSSAPKFPQPQNMILLFHHYRLTGQQKSLAIACATLDAIANGGIHDQLGGGFHRYATDPQWCVPHFEKMLYDQAALSCAYLEAYQLTGQQHYASVAGKTLDYVLRDLRDPQGGFYCGEDADSEGREGAFYLWTEAELKQVIGDDYPLLKQYFHIELQGNFNDEASGQRNGENILHRIGQPASTHLTAKLKNCCVQLFNHRQLRQRPQRDEKILTSWNGLMISALARGAGILQQPRYLEAAKQATNFIDTQLFNQQGQLKRRYCDGETAIGAFASDYSFYARGCLDLFDASADPYFLQQASRLATTLLKQFCDPIDGVLYSSDHNAEQLPLRLKNYVDGAIISENSAAVEVLIRLYQHTDDIHWQRAAEKMLNGCAAVIDQHPLSGCQLLFASCLIEQPPQHWQLAIDNDSENSSVSRQALACVRQHLSPNVVLKVQRTGIDISEKVKGGNSERQIKMIDNQPTLYRCRQQSCQPPLVGIKRIEEALQRPASADDENRSTEPLG